GELAPDEHVANVSRLTPESPFDVAHYPLAPQAIEHSLALARIGPQAELVDRAADQLLAPEADELGIAGVDVDHPSFRKRANDDPDGAGLEDLEEAIVVETDGVASHRRHAASPARGEGVGDLATGDGAVGHSFRAVRLRRRGTTSVSPNAEEYQTARQRK